MRNSLASDVIASIDVAARNARALDAALDELRKTVADRHYEKVEAIRERMLAAVDAYVDHYVAAALRVDAERGA